MTGVMVSFDMEITTSIPPARMFMDFVLHAHNLIPKMLPQAIQTLEIKQVGTVKLISFGEGDNQFNGVSHQVNRMDTKNCFYSCSIIEGDALMGVLEKISYEITIEASSNGGSVCKNTSKYQAQGGVGVGITEHQINNGKEKAGGMFREVEAFLLANPHAHKLKML